MSQNDNEKQVSLWRRYEVEKAKAREDYETPKEYETRIKAIVRKLGI